MICFCHASADGFCRSPRRTTPPPNSGWMAINKTTLVGRKGTESFWICYEIFNVIPMI